jgi:hypothetical protein
MQQVGATQTIISGYWRDHLDENTRNIILPLDDFWKGCKVSCAKNGAFLKDIFYFFTLDFSITGRITPPNVGVVE